MNVTAVNERVARYRKKPVVVDAVQWTGYNYAEIKAFAGGNVKSVEGPDVLQVLTLEGPVIAQRNDWIIRGTAGEFYPCKPEIFNNIYEFEASAK